MNRHARNVIVLAVALMIVLPGSAFSETKISAGIKGGLNYTMPAGDDMSGEFEDLDWIGFELDSTLTGISLIELNSASITDISSMTSFLFGGFVNIKLHESFSVQPEIIYVRKGGTQDFEIGTTIGGLLPVDFDGKLTWKLDYLDIPVLAKYTIPTEGSIAPSLFAGPALGILVSSNLEVELMSISQDVDIESIVKSVDFGLVFGACADIDLGPTKFITVEGRYELGLSDWTDEPLIDLVSLKNGGLQFMAGFGFRFGE